MENTIHRNSTNHYSIAAWIIVTTCLLLAISIHLLSALLAGLIVYELVHVLTSYIRITYISRKIARIAAVSVLAIIVVTGLTLFILGTVTFFHSDAGSLPKLLQKMADIIEGSRSVLPVWISDYLPGTGENIKIDAAKWLREHSVELQTLGGKAARGAGHILIGMVIGVLISLEEVVSANECRPLSCALIESITKLSEAFRRVVFAQVRIAALNAVITWLYLDIILPLIGVHLPFAKTMVIVTFLVGLLPIIGNLVSNTVIVIISLSYSLPIALTSLGFLILVHKLEYFLNARIVGSQINSKAWEILIAMMIMEAIFGIRGIIAAPIYYAYLKRELMDRNLV